MIKRITDDRMKHMHAVAEYMYEHANEYDLGEKKNELYVLGLIHDIGLLNGDIIGHEASGYELVESMGLENWMAQAIRWHGSSPTEYKNYFGYKDDSQIPKYLLLLWEADMHIGANGGYKTYDERLHEINVKNIKMFGTNDWDKTGKEIVELLRKFGRK